MKLYTCRGWSNRMFPAFWTPQGHKRTVRSQTLARQQSDPIIQRCKVSQPAETKFSPAHRSKQWLAKEGEWLWTGSHCYRDLYLSMSKTIEKNIQQPAININVKKSVLSKRYVYPCMRTLNFMTLLKNSTQTSILSSSFQSWMWLSAHLLTTKMEQMQLRQSLQGTNVYGDACV